MRSACETVHSSGLGSGGGLATIRARAGDNARASLQQELAALQAELVSQHGVFGVHVGWAVPEVTNVPTAETQLRQLTGEDFFDVVLLVEGIGRREVEDMIDDARAALGKMPGLEPNSTLTYELAYDLTDGDLQ